ncbi:hypothetical protein HPC49_32750 [Pyxidicoccus fallax]|uniref:Uncharacterized protein n=1 Tax=Pyxidicoccus fallax TaxID=394095 RepID=A0A848LVP3_9BACT|nr:hypothetical protein [Pyxidicoccus fallax]NMO21690.1 hypothetical protein [Pyxidicoccus fallax]NPC82980.1 hypothetical protein [Pyxidicoccus fallax]
MQRIRDFAARHWSKLAAFAPNLHIRRRWYHILGLALIGAAGAIPLLGLTSFCTYADKTIFFAPVALAALIAAILTGRFPSLSGLRHFATYPPTWISAIIGLPIISIAYFTVPKLEGRCAGLGKLSGSLPAGELCLWGAAFICSIFAICVIAGRVMNGAKTRSEVAALLKELGRDSREDLGKPNTSPGNSLFIKSIESDAPAANLGVDAFCRRDFAQRIVDHIAAKTAAIAIIGSRGAGKTSLYNFVREFAVGRATTSRPILFVRASLWPYGTVEAGVRGILEQAAGALSSHINMSMIWGLPDAYIDAMETGGFGLARLLRRSRSPEQILGDFNSICSAAGITIVLWVEDIDRFAATAGIDKEERLEPVRALLHAFSTSSAVLPVLVASRLGQGFDLEKLVRRVEYIPSLSRAAVLDILAGFTEEQEKTNPLVNLGIKPNRAWLEFNAHFERTGLSKPSHSLADLLRTPRILKHALRLAKDTWDRLAGEIDLDDVLCLSAIQSTHPRVLDFVRHNIRWLQNPFGEDEKERNAQYAELTRQLESLMSTAPGDMPALLEVLNFVFPGGLQPSGFGMRSKKLQGVSVRSRHADYFERFLIREAPTNADVDTIGEIRKFQSAQSAELPALLFSARQESVAYFSKRLLLEAEASRLLELAFSLAIDLLGTAAMTPLVDSGLREAMSIYDDVHDSAPFDSNVLFSVLARATSRLDVVLMVVDHYAGPSNRPKNTEVVAAPFRTELRNILARELSPDISAAVLATKLRGCNPFMLRSIVWDYSPKEEEPIPEWPRVRESLVQAAGESSDILAHISRLFVSEGAGLSAKGAFTERYAVQEPAFRALFPERHVILDILAAQEHSRSDDIYIQAAHQYSVAQLAKESATPNAS